MPVRRHGSVHVRAIIELIDDARCSLFGEPDDNTDHGHCLYLAASWPQPEPFSDLDSDDGVTDPSSRT